MNDDSHSRRVVADIARSARRRRMLQRPRLVTVSVGSRSWTIGDIRPEQRRGLEAPSEWSQEMALHSAPLGRTLP